MTKAQHTPGPWHIEPTVHSDRLNIFGIAENQERHIGTLISGSKRELTELRANARLIAAAPKMLEALQAMSNDASRAEWDEGIFTGEMAWDLIENARAIIREATGGEG